MEKFLFECANCNLCDFYFVGYSNENENSKLEMLEYRCCNCGEVSVIRVLPNKKES